MDTIPAPVPPRQRGPDLFDLVLQHPDVAVPPRATGEATAWCPWHPDKDGDTPNLGINVKKKVVKCFVCGKGGIRKLAQAWGIEVPAAREKQRAPNEPFMSADAAMRDLASAYGLDAKTIEHFGIEPAPDIPSANRSARGAWRYPTHCGTRYKAFDRKATGKYWWSRGTSKEKRIQELYGARDIPKGTTVVYLVNGEPSVWVCWQAGIAGVAAFGEGALPAPAIEDLKARGVNEIHVVLDLDDAGAYAAHRDLAIIREAGLEAIAHRLPDYLGDKADVADLATWVKYDAEAFKAALEHLDPWEPPNPQPLEGTRFSVRNNKIMVSQMTREGELLEPAELTNFIAWGVDETRVDDGINQTTWVTMHVETERRRRIPDIRIKLADRASMKWLADVSGDLRINARNSAEKQVHEVIQRLTEARQITPRTVLGHTGWREVDGKLRYLFPRSDDERDQGIEVELEPDFRRYALPANPEDPRGAVRASYRFLDVADARVTIPVLGYVYLAPLQSILRPAFVLWLRAQTGSYKSSLTALALSHFGDFEYDNPPLTWESTANAIERYLFVMKDSLAWLDDFAPKSTQRGLQMLDRLAEQVMRPMGNRQARGRMDVNLRMRQSQPPRALLISTAEIYPSGQSVLARLIPIDFSHEQVDLAQLTFAQQERDRYPHAMAAYIAWVGERYEQLVKDLPARVAKLRDELAYDDRAHARIRQAVAVMLVALDLFGEFAQDVGAMSAQAAIELRLKARGVFDEMARTHAGRVSDENFSIRTVNVIDTLLGQGKVVFMPKGSDKEPPVGKDLLGWYDDQLVYLDPVATFHRIAQWCREEERSFGTDEAGMRQALVEAGMVVAQEDGRLTARVSVNGRRHRVLALSRERVPFAEHFPKVLF